MDRARFQSERLRRLSNGGQCDAAQYLSGNPCSVVPGQPPLFADRSAKLKLGLCNRHLEHVERSGALLMAGKTFAHGVGLGSLPGRSPYPEAAVRWSMFSALHSKCLTDSSNYTILAN